MLKGEEVYSSPFNFYLGLSSSPTLSFSEEKYRGRGLKFNGRVFSIQDG
jgi:hypothetical protein